MASPSPKSFLSYQEILEKTRLGRLCGKSELFKERYQILQVLGRGGFGVTFLGRNVVLPGTPVCVIKYLCLPQGSLPDAFDRAKTRFRTEAKVLSLLGHHSQIPLLLDYFVIDDEFYLVQEFIKGYTLSKIVKNYGPQPEEFVIRTLKSMLPVLSYIHGQGVIHRDLKPQNIILAADDGRLVLIDFGSVKEEFHLGDDASGGITQHFIGTLGFSAPEQYSLRTVYASDVYALGMTCIFLLTGKKPADLQDQNNKNKFIWKDKVDISPHFMTILDKMIDYDLKARYLSAQEVLEDLENSEHIMTNFAKAFEDTDLNHGLSIQRKQAPASSGQTKTKAFSQGHTPQDKPEYRGDLLKSYSAYSKLAQGKNNKNSPPLGETKTSPSSSQTQERLSKNSKIVEEITEIQEESTSFFPKLMINLQNFLRKINS